MMLTILFAAALLAEPVTPADAPNVTVYARLPLDGAWLWPSYVGNEPTFYATYAQPAAPRAATVGRRGGYAAPARTARAARAY